MINFPGFQDEYLPEREGDRLIWTPKRLSKTVPTMHRTSRTSPETFEMYAYVVKLGGLNVFVNGEVRNCPYFYPWLVNLRQSEWQPDLCLAIFCFKGSWREGFRSHLIKLFDPAIIHLHELEFGHTFMMLWEEDARPLFADTAREINGNDLFWGDHVHIARE